jgi:YteA family regulatory protein
MTGPLPEQQERKLRQRLLEEKQALESRLLDGGQDSPAMSWRESAGELSSNDNHPADIGTDLFERGKDLARREQARLRLETIEQALHRMDQGLYGLCAVCGRPIPPERLEAAPETVYCVEHHPKRRQPETRPAEESFLHPPFGRTSMDEKDDQAGFDGEDAWQTVEAWGNSDSPAMAENPEADYEGLMIEADERDGAVEPLESFLVTDITGRNVSFVRNRAYERYLESGEGDPLLETAVQHAETVGPVPADPWLLELSPLDPEAPDPVPPEEADPPRGGQ